MLFQSHLLFLCCLSKPDVLLTIGCPNVLDSKPRHPALGRCKASLLALVTVGPPKASFDKTGSCLNSVTVTPDSCSPLLADGRSRS